MRNHGCAWPRDGSNVPPMNGTRVSPEDDADAFAAVQDLRAARNAAGIVLPMPAADRQAPGVRMADLGGVSPDVARRPAHALRQEGATP